MISNLVNLFGRTPTKKNGATSTRQSGPRLQPNRRQQNSRRQTFSKVFRWSRQEGQPGEPASVEVVGSFTDWKRVALAHNSRLNSWELTLHDLPANKTHHYMILVDGEPVYDETCDGLAIPSGYQEERYQLATDRGPRVLMLFSQTR